MARQHRRLIYWFLGTLAALIVTAMVAVWWFIDPERLRVRIEAEATAALGRSVRLHAPLHFKPGWRIAIAGGAGEVGNAPGFGTEPLARWTGVELGIALRPLLRREVQVDRVVVDGLVLDLQRDAAGRVNWELPGLQAADGDPGGADPANAQAGEAGSFSIDAVALRAAAVRFRDATTGADWRVQQLDLAVELPADLAASPLQFGDVVLAARLSGGPLPAAGVPLQIEAPLVELALPAVSLPRFAVQWAEARIEGSVDAVAGDVPAVNGHIKARAPSLRALLASAGITPPPMNDPGTLGAFSLETTLRYAEGAAGLTALTLQLDETRLTGSASLPSLSPLALRFDLAADRMDVDRYLAPDAPDDEPFELPLAQLQALDAKGVLRIDAATVAGAAAKQVRIDVE